jgi:hypothetical protein
MYIKTDRQTGRLATYRQIYIGRHAGRQAERQTDRQTYRQTGRQADRQTYRQTDRQTDRQTFLLYSKYSTLWGLPPRNQWGPLTR